MPLELCLRLREVGLQNALPTADPLPLELCSHLREVGLEDLQIFFVLIGQILLCLSKLLLGPPDLIDLMTELLKI